MHEEKNSFEGGRTGKVPGSGGLQDMNSYRSHRALIAIVFVITIFCFVYQMTLTADLWLRMEQGGDLKLLKISLNGEKVWSVDSLKIHEERAFFSIKPKSKENHLAVTIFHQQSKKSEELSCEFKRTAHRCLIEVYLTNSAFYCTDCVRD